MADIKPDSIVQANGERFVRRVLLIKGDQALCQRMLDKSEQWFPLTGLTLQPPSRPMHFHF